MIPQQAASVAPTPRVSVVMPLYNAASTLEATIASVLAQSFEWFELIIVDDGSSDDSLKLARALAATDQRLRVVSRSNGGVSSARNLGASLGTAPLIAFIDADDLWHRDKLSHHVAMHRGMPTCAASYARIAFIDEDAAALDGAKTHSSLCPRKPQLHDVLGENPVCTASNFVVRRDWFEAAGGFNETLSFAEDQDLVARIVCVGGEVAGIDAVLVGYRFSPQGLSMDLDRMHEGWRRVAIQFLDPAALAALDALYCRYLARRVLRAGGRPALALRYAVSGLRLDAAAFLRDRRRGFATLLGAVAAPLMPSAWRLRLFA